MNEHHEKLILVLNETEGKGLSHSEALQLLLAGELSSLKDGMDHLK
ncbi:TPA: hypothetical protein ACIBIV_002100 [Salmonella enterica subsp. enterica serovar Birkenhead]